MPSAVCLGATAYGASAHHRCNYAANRWSPAHPNLQSTLETVQDRNTIRAHNFNMACMEESLGS